MKKIIYETFGNPVDVLKAVEAPSVPLTEGQVRVEILRAPINPSDLNQISGNYGVRPPLPTTAGNEGLGRIVEGEGTGQLVLLPGGCGTWATEAVCDANHLVPLPEGDLDQLSMLLVNPATASLMLSEYVDLQAGDWIIQSAANSAVGGYIVQMAKARGLNLVNVVRRESAIAGLKEMGADVVLVDGPDLAQRVKKATGAKMKLAIDAVAGATAGRLADTLDTGATLINYGGMSNEDSAIGAAALIFNNITVRGFWLVVWMNTADKAARRALYTDLAGQIVKGELFAPIDKHFSLDEIAAAVEYSWAGGRDGKVMIAPNGV
ncbi:MAG: zinc-dependent alcohol dehydrogenase family protein [Sulfitobacter sp.]